MKKNKLSTAQQKRLGIIALVIAIVVMGLLVWLVGVPLVRFASQPERFRAWVDSHVFCGRLDAPRCIRWYLSSSRVSAM